jgi:hypothetical protein
VSKKKNPDPKEVVYIAEYGDGQFLYFDFRRNERGELKPVMLLKKDIERAIVFKTADEANRWAAYFSAKRARRKDGAQWTWRLIKFQDGKQTVSRFVTQDEVVYWREAHMITHPHLFGLAPAIKERGKR